MARVLVARLDALLAAILARRLGVLPRLGEPKILSPSPMMFLEKLPQESSFLASHPVVIRSLLYLSHQNLGAHLKRTVEKGDNCSFQKKRRGNDLNRIHDPKSDLDDFDYDPEYDEGRFDDDCDERYTETRLQREDYERNMDESERIITDQHRKEFMARAFPATLPLGDDVPHQTKVATIKMCHSKADFDKIINIVDNWHPELKIRDMEKGPERDNLLRFRKQFPAGNKLHFQYSVSTVHLPGCSPRKVLRKLELHKASGQLRPGRIVVSKEEVFDCIHDWHKFSQHLGQERSWRAT